jgi:UDP-GlcNAc3NAcA epimerase
VSRFALATIHRAAITGDPNALRSVVEALGSLEMPVLLPLHPRTRQALELYDLLGSIPDSVSIKPPLGYLEAIAAVRDATAVITDSGGLQREAYWLGTPCVTLRSDTEWIETVECGANTLVAPVNAPQELGAAVLEQCRKKQEHPWTADAYGDGHAAERVTDAIAANPAWGSDSPLTAPVRPLGGNART